MNYEDIQLAPHPKNISVSLYKHQLASIYKMERIELNNTIDIGENTYRKTKIGILGEIVGFGKTLTILGLISRNKMEWVLSNCYVCEKTKIESDSLITTYSISRHTRLPTNLILAPPSIIPQWVEELNKTKLKYTCVITKNDLTELQAENFDVIIVAPLIYNKLVAVYSNCAWKRFIFDEPGQTKVAGMSHVKAGFYWFMTATPTDIYNKHYRCNKGSFMRDIVGTSSTDFNDIIQTITVKNDPEFVKASFEIPETFHHYYNCFQPIYNVIHEFVCENIRNMIDSGDVEGAIQALGGTKTENIVELILEKKKTEIAELDIKLQLYQLRNDEEKIKEIDEKKIRINTQIEELEIKFNSMLNTPCNICLEDLSEPVLETNCQNVFCGKCLLSWIKNNSSCPLCRAQINNENLVYIKTKINTEAEVERTFEKRLTKLEKIVELITKNKKGKFLIFSDFDGSFTAIKNVLLENDIPCNQLRGNISAIEKIISNFKSGKVRVIFLNSKYNGAGINLQEATDIILYHQMGFNLETQILGRANRIGRTIPLNVHHLKIAK